MVVGVYLFVTSDRHTIRLYVRHLTLLLLNHFRNILKLTVVSMMKAALGEVITNAWRTPSGASHMAGTFEDDYSRSAHFFKHYTQTIGMRLPPVIGDDPVIARWESWRFWESLASGCATVALDFEEYGLVLPVIPKNGYGLTNLTKQ
jgi:hypothetical protein